MAATPSTMVPLGTSAPDFILPDTISGKAVSLRAAKGQMATVIMFICNHCPYVKLLNETLVRVAGEYKSKGVSFIAISSNDVVQYPDDAPDKMSDVARTLGFPFPYLYDESQDVARAYDAACTPDFYVFDKDMKLHYRGQFDDARPGNGITPSGKDLIKAMDALIEGKRPAPEQRPSIGCNIKWKK
jgi:peroxiredoxin